MQLTMFEEEQAKAHEEFARAVAHGALVVSNHSGGKDSQIMLIKLLEMGVPREQLIVVHASLGEVEWEGALELARVQAADAGLKFIVAKAEKTLFDMVRARHVKRPEVPSWPSASTRACTSDLKRGPIAREVRRFATARGFNLVVNCLGFRSEESPARAKRRVWSVNESQSNSRRQWFEYLPIHEMTRDAVFSGIAAAGQSPHWAYALGNDRLSCVFCIMGSESDLRNGANARPALARDYITLEELTGYTMHMSRRPLREIIAA